MSKEVLIKIFDTNSKCIGKITKTEKYLKNYFPIFSKKNITNSEFNITSNNLELVNLVLSIKTWNHINIKSVSDILNIIFLQKQLGMKTDITHLYNLKIKNKKDLALLFLIIKFFENENENNLMLKKTLIDNMEDNNIDDIKHLIYFRNTFKLVVNFDNHKTIFYDIFNGNILNTICSENNFNNEIMYSSNFLYYVTRSWLNLSIFKTNTNEKICQIPKNQLLEFEINYTNYSNIKNLLLIYYKFGNCILYDISNLLLGKEEIKKNKLPQYCSYSIFSEDDSLLFLTDECQTIYIYDIINEKIILHYEFVFNETFKTAKFENNKIIIITDMDIYSWSYSEKLIEKIKNNFDSIRNYTVDINCKLNLVISKNKNFYLKIKNDIYFLKFLSDNLFVVVSKNKNKDKNNMITRIFDNKQFFLLGNYIILNTVNNVYLINR